MCVHDALNQREEFLPSYGSMPSNDDASGARAGALGMDAIDSVSANGVGAYDGYGSDGSYGSDGGDGGGFAEYGGGDGDGDDGEYGGADGYGDGDGGGGGGGIDGEGVGPISLEDAFREKPQTYEDVCRSHIVSSPLCTERTNFLVFWFIIDHRWHKQLFINANGFINS